MKTLRFLLIFAIIASAVAWAQDGSFTTLEKVMDRETYERSGLRKLSSDERAALDAFIRDYVAAKQKDAAEVAATEAVDRAVKERRVDPPSVIESRIVGSFKGYGPRTVFRLTNGETWKPTDADVLTIATLEDPRVVIYKDFFGYKMFVEGASTIRVKRVR